MDLIWAAIHIINSWHIYFYFSDVIQGEASEVIPVNGELSGKVLSKLWTNILSKNVHSKLFGI